MLLRSTIKYQKQSSIYKKDTTCTQVYILRAVIAKGIRNLQHWSQVSWLDVFGYGITDHTQARLKMLW